MIAKAKPASQGPATPTPSVPSTPEPPLSVADEADMKQTGRLKRYLTEQVSSQDLTLRCPLHSPV